MIIEIDFSSEIPVYMQLRHQIVIAIGEGKLSAGASLPTTRQMAKNAGINPMTVSKAYQLLKKEGFIVIDRRHGAKVVYTDNKSDDILDNMKESLTLLVAEAKVKGISSEAFIKCIKEIYGEEVL